MNIIIFIIPLLFSNSIFASEEPCPKKVSTKQTIVKNISGWSIFQDSNDIHILRMVDFYSGNPKKMAQLAPDNKDSLNDPVWTFGENDEIWQVCRYTNTKISLTRKLKAGLKSCAVKYNKQVSPQIDSIICN
jgi:hypothetical protein